LNIIFLSETKSGISSDFSHRFIDTSVLLDLFISKELEISEPISFS